MTNWQTGLIDNTLHYASTGGNKPPFVLAHGYTDNGLCWRRVALTLENTYDVIMPDARGHGQSPNPSEPYTAELHAADLARLIETLNLDQPAVMGHSMGAVNTALLAATFPKHTRAIILIDPPWHISPGQNDMAAWLTWKENLSRQQTLNRDELMTECRANNPAWHPIEIEAWANAKQQFDIRTFDLLNIFSIPWQTTIQRLQCPTLLVYAENGLVTQAIAQEAQSLSPHVQLLYIPDAGHSIQRDQFNSLMAGIQPFLNAL